MGADQYDIGSGLSVPGLEAVIEYGDASRLVRDSIPGAMRIHDRSVLELIRLTQIDGLQDDPDGRDARQDNSDTHGESVGEMFYGGRTIGLTGQAEAGSIPAMRDIWRRFTSQFGRQERDLLIHVPGEVAQISNMLANPSFDVDASRWTGGAGTISRVLDTSVGVGQVERTGASGAGTVTASHDDLPPFLNYGTIVSWAGEDVFVSALVKVTAATGTVSSIEVGVKAYTNDTSVSQLVVGEAQASPIMGQWYMLSGRISGSSLADSTVMSNPSIQWVTIYARLSHSTAGDFTFLIDKAMLVLLDASDPTPTGYFDASTDGFEALLDPFGVVVPILGSDVIGSIGPSYAVNKIYNPRLLTLASAPSTQETVNWSAVLGTGIAASTPSTSVVAGEHTALSTYGHFFKSADSTSRDFKMFAADPNGYQSLSPVEPGRTYRWRTRVKVEACPPTGTLYVMLEWYDRAGVLLSTTLSDPLATSGVTVGIATGAAPDEAVWARPVIGLIGTTTPNGELSIFVSDPCFVDVTDHDPGDFFGLEPNDVESSQELDGTYGIQPPVRRRLPRPFLIKGVRKTPGGAKAPEQQSNMIARRPFTMSLRASDPRIYVLDKRRHQIRLSGTPELIVHQAPDGFSGASGLPVPDGYTYEGEYTTYAGSGPNYEWSDWLSGIGTGYLRKLPAGGIGPVTYDPHGSFGPGGGTFNTPAQDIKTRMYRSAEGFTYETPRVILGGAPQSFGLGSAPPTDLSGMVVRVAGTAGSRTFKYNDVTILLKRVSSTTWLELRWNSWTNGAGLGGVYNPGTEPNAPYAFELWCSHDEGGTLTTTRLAQWDYDYYDISGGFYSFRPSIDPMWMTAWMIDETVYWELWSTYPNLSTTVGRLQSDSYSIPSGLQSVIGSSVAGHVGWSTRIGGDGDTSDFQTLAVVQPFMHYFEAYDASLPPVSASLPVIGSIDTPQVIELRGGLIDPIISISTPEHIDGPARSSVARFNGTIDDSNPIFVNVADGSVRDQFGVSRRDLVIPGSTFVPFAPGINNISIQARGWDESTAAHVITSWRDALRS